VLEKRYNTIVSLKDTSAQFSLELMLKQRYVTRLLNPDWKSSVRGIQYNTN